MTLQIQRCHYSQEMCVKQIPLQRKKKRQTNKKKKLRNCSNKSKRYIWRKKKQFAGK